MVEGTVIVTGAGGMLGQDVMQALSAAGMRAIGYEKGALDITDRDDVEKIGQHEPSVVINCAAYTKVDDAEVEREECNAVNADGVRNLVRFCESHDALLVQISTDYVFDGKKKGYDEDDPTDPINYYGKTKEVAERVAETAPRHLIVRTAWLYGRHGKNFVETILGRAGELDSLKVVDDQHGSPTHTKDLAEALLGLLDRENGIYHLTNSGVCTWYEFAKEIVRLSGEQCRIVPVPSATYKRIARRPRYSILNNSKTEKLRSWKEALKEYMDGR